MGADSRSPSALHQSSKRRRSSLPSLDGGAGASDDLGLAGARGVIFVVPRCAAEHGPHRSWHTHAALPFALHSTVLPGAGRTEAGKCRIFMCYASRQMNMASLQAVPSSTSW